MRHRPMIEIELIIFVVTERAVMVGREDVNETDQIWLPRRAIEFEAGYQPEAGDGNIMILMPEALALQKGLI